jgi:RNA polymerase sigma-70 factor (sigma-E family)
MGEDHPAPDDGGFVAWATVRRTGLRHAAYLLCGDWTRADDLVQETLVRVYLRWRRIAAGRADAYARRVLATSFVDEHRRPWRREAVTEVLPEQPHVDVAPAGSAVIEALRQVPAGQRAVLVLRFWEDLSVEQTAEVLGCSTGNVKSQSARGLARLRELFPEDELTYHEEGLR